MQVDKLHKCLIKALTKVTKGDKLVIHMWAVYALLQIRMTSNV